MTVQALNAKKHVLCQKPMAITLADADKMVSASEMQNRRLQIMTCMRYMDNNRKIKEIIDNNDIGNIVYIQYSQRGRFFPYPKGVF
jgi:predicted dehydrogenase